MSLDTLVGETQHIAVVLPLLGVEFEPIGRAVVGGDGLDLDIQHRFALPHLNGLAETGLVAALKLGGCSANVTAASEYRIAATREAVLL